jgi:hypothetical protein
MAININILSNFNGSGFTKLEKELKRLDTPMEKLGAVSRSLAPAAAVGLTALTAMGLSAVRAAEEAQVANNRLDAVAKSMNLFGSATDTVTDRLKAFAEENERSLAVDADIIKSTQAKLLTFKNLAQTADQTGGAMDRATLAALDLAAAGFGTAETNAVQLGKALQDPIKGITALARSGVTFTEAEKEKIKALVESGKLLEAQDIILGSLETQVGGTAEATATGSAKMTLAFLAMQDAIGEALLPLFEKMVPLVIGFFDWIGKNSGVVTVLAGLMAGLAVAILAVNFALNANPIVKVITLIAALVAAVALLINWLVELYGGWDKLFKDLGKWLTDIGRFFASIWNGIAGVFKGVIDTISGLWTAYTNRLTQGIETFSSVFSKVWNGLGNIARGALNGVIGFVEGWINRVIGGVNNLIGLINTVLSAGSAIGLNVQIPRLNNVSLPRLAEGGIVMPQPGGVIAQLAEAGQPEAVIPLNRLGDFGGGATYNVTVNAGIGADGNKIGQAIVDQILKFERSSGQVFARA